MQILNISVQNRPSKSVTSRPYAYEFSESVGYSVDVSGHQSNYITRVKAQYSAGFADGIIRTLLNKYSLGVQPTEYSAGIGSAQITYQVVYHKYKATPVSSKYSAGLADAFISRKVAYIKYKLDDTRAVYSAGLADVQITK